MKFDVTFTGRRSLKGRKNPGLNWRSFDLQLKALPMSYIPIQVAAWLFQNLRQQLFFFFFSLCFQQAMTISYCIGGLVVEFSPAVGGPGFDSPPMHLRSNVVKACRTNYFMKFDVTFYGLPSDPFLFFVFLFLGLQQALTIVYCIGDSVLEFLPATWETGFRFSANAFTI